MLVKHANWNADSLQSTPHRHCTLQTNLCMRMQLIPQAFCQSLHIIWIVLQFMVSEQGVLLSLISNSYLCMQITTLVDWSIVHRLIVCGLFFQWFCQPLSYPKQHTGFCKLHIGTAIFRVTWGFFLLVNMSFVIWLTWLCRSENSMRQECSAVKVETHHTGCQKRDDSDLKACYYIFSINTITRFAEIEWL